jgi:hypothetical protein
MRLNEIYIEFIRGKNLSDAFCLKQGDALTSLLFSFAVVYSVMKFQERQKGLKLNGTH